MLTAWPLAGQDSPGAPPLPPDARATQNLRWQGVGVDDQRGDGSVWVLAEGYKACFADGLATFIPYFGPLASRNWPFAMRLLPGAQSPVAATTPRAEGRRVTVRHGSIDEIYELAEASLEQRFLVHERPAKGDLVLRLALETDLQPKGREEGLGLVFEGPDGRMAYGDAVAIDAEGRRLAFAPALVGSALELRVPEAFAATARYPILVDPVLLAIPVANTNSVEIQPDVAWSPKQSVWTVVFERVFSSTDSDVVAVRLTAGGSVLGTTSVAATANREVSSQVAVGTGTAAIDRFVFAWVRVTSSGRILESRDRLADRDAFETVRAIDSGGNVGQAPFTPSLGGSKSTTLAHGPCLVLYDFASSVNHELRVRTINPGGSLGSIRTVVTQPGCAPQARLNKCSTKPRWAVVWSEHSGVICRPGTIFAMFVTDSGTVVGAQQISSGSSDNEHPAVGGDGDQFFVTWLGDDSVSQSAVFGAHVTLSGGFQRRFVKNLTLNEPNGRPSVAHDQPVVDFDGCRLVCAYGEQALTRAMTFGVTPDLKDALFQEGHVLVDAHANQASRAIAAQGSAGGPPGFFLIAWQDTDPNTDVRAALYAGRASTPHRFLNASCSAIPPELVVVGPPALGLQLGVDLRGTAAAPVLMFGGPSLLVPLCRTTFGRCGLGVSPIVIQGGTSFRAPIPCDVRLAGASVFFQGFDILAKGGCVTPFALTSTDILEVIIQ